MDRLEKRFAAQGGEGGTLPIDPDLLAVEEAYGELNARENDGRPYSHREFCRLAITRGLQKRGYSSSRIAELEGGHLALFEEAGHFEDEDGGGGDTYW